MEDEEIWMTFLNLTPNISKPTTLRLMGDFKYMTWLRNGAPGNPHIAQFAAHMNKAVTAAPAKNETERLLFILRVSDIRALRDAPASTTGPSTRRP